MLRVWRDDGRCVGVLTDRRAIAARATLLATGGYAALWERTTNPPGAIGEGLARVPRRRRAGRPRVRAVPPDGARRLVAPALRGAARRGRAPAGRRRQPLHRRARAARRRRARDRRARHGAARPAPDRPRRFPALMGRLADEGYDPARDADPGLAGGALHGGRHRHRPRRAHRARPACTRPASAPHRRARREPARLELAARVPRLRPSCGARRAGEPGLPSAAAPRSDPAAPASREPVTPELRAALWRDSGLIRDAAGLERLLARRTCSRGSSPRARSRARRAAAATSARLPGRGRGVRGPRRPPARRRAGAGDMAERPTRSSASSTPRSPRTSAPAT